MNKKEIINHLERIAVYMEIKGENTFKISAYRKAAQALENDERSINDIEDVAKLSGIGKGTAGLINEVKEHGDSELLQTLKKEIPEGLLPLLRLPGLGGKKIGKLYQELGITNAADLKKACEENQIRELAGFAAKSEEKIMKALEEMGSRPERLPIPLMLKMADSFEEKLAAVEGMHRYARAGSLRRLEETVKDMDYIISTDNPARVKEQIKAFSGISSVIADGDTKLSLELEGEEYPVQVDVRMIEDEAFATTLHHFTGSKDHNVKMRQLAKSNGERISEYGIENVESGDVQTFTDEAAFFGYYGMQYIPPEARAGKDELDVYSNPREDLTLPLIRGDMHMHTTWSDGAQSVEEMAEEARKRGYEWIAITDHSKFLRVAHGLDEDRILRQIEEIKTVNEKYTDLQIFAGIEMDIRPDGILDIEDTVLEQLDIVIASIHSSFSQERSVIMERFESALTSPHVDLIAHPTGRLIGRRPGYDADLPKLIKRAAETGTALELNANPNRLDLSAEWLKKAAEAGVALAVNTDAHNPEMMDDMEIGTGIARKAMLRPGQVLNTLTAAELTDYLREKKEKRRLQ
ncbi:DNA polymerase (family 10) [Sinobaca qinghaiensis]|uniref:DNA polymerase (Family 10) n=1 Tax=Sinobaca qinghaiensis TaxID=342944 RepID=A0A419V731_9BACL|nr:DNA polymerase/3'-5' exonuclease PolX [Sinobaca qinghaiensis]RKD75716.1 DNA polymerase (family 10) [Sinobaca qinghaiensis]